MKLGDHVRLTKISSIRPGSLPDGYWSEGFLLLPICRGEPILMERYSRAAREPGETSPVICLGAYESSAVQLWSRSDDGSVGIKTENSVWRLDYLTPSSSVTVPRDFGVNLTVPSVHT